MADSNFNSSFSWEIVLRVLCALRAAKAKDDKTNPRTQSARRATRQMMTTPSPPPPVELNVTPSASSPSPSPSPPTGQTIFSWFARVIIGDRRASLYDDDRSSFLPHKCSIINTRMTDAHQWRVPFFAKSSSEV